jgi:predicted esterase
VLAGYLVHRPELQLHPGRVAGRPVLVAHGADDTTVDTLRGRAAWKVLDRAGAEARWVEVEGRHRLGPPLLEPLRTFLEDLAEAPRP